MKKIITIFCLLILSIGSLFPQENISKNFTATQWLEDLDFVVTKLKKVHPNIYSRISSEDFARLIENSRLKIEKSASYYECYNVIRKVVASVKDCHTRLGYNGAVSFFINALPVKIECFTDGYFITAVDEKNKELLGSRVTAIEGVPIKDVMDKIVEISNGDNEFARINIAKYVLRYPPILNSLGIGSNNNEVKFTLINGDGKSIEQLFRHNKDDNDNNLYTIRSSLQNNMPLHIKNRNKNYWFEHIKNNKMMFFQFNSVGDEEDSKAETFEQFTTRIWNYIDNNKTEIDKLIIDLRNNGGGQGRMVIPFIKEIIKRDWINTNGKLFVLLGMETGSAAVVMATELLQYTESIFIGDPPSSPSNLFSDNITVGNLPNSGYPLIVATRTIDNGWTIDRDIFTTDIPAPFSSREYFSGIDPAIEAILSNGAVPINVIASEKGNDAALSVVKKWTMKYPGMNWWHSAVEYRINVASYNSLHAGFFAKTDELKKSNFAKCEQLLILNTLLFPESSNAFNTLGEVYAITGQKELAIANYEKSLKLDPNNQSSINALKRLKGK